MNIKTVLGAFLFFLLLMGSLTLKSCSSDSGSKKKSNNKTAKTKITDYTDIYTEDLIRQVFDVDDDIPIEFEHKEKANMLTYKWETFNEDAEKLQFQVDFNAIDKEKLGTDDIDKIWEKQDRIIFKEYALTNVPNVGNKANWTEYGGGQLRFATDDNIYFITTNSYHLKQGELGTVWDRDNAIKKSKALAQEILKEL